LNGVDVSGSLVFSGGPSSWNVNYPGLLPNQTYVVAIHATDNNGGSVSGNLTIDTWAPVLQFEAEDFDFDPASSPITNGTGYRFIDNPVPTPAGIAASNSYEGQLGDELIDQSGVGAGTRDYRPGDVATTPVTDTPRAQFIAANAQDYNVGFLGAGFWEDYTRTWPAGTFNVYGRMASGASASGLPTPPGIRDDFDLIVAGAGTTNQVLQYVGVFNVPTTNGYSAYSYIPLIDKFGNYANVTMDGIETFRSTLDLTTTTGLAQFGLNINFYMLTAPRTDLPRIDSVYPDGSVLMQWTNTFSFVASNPTYGINTTNIHVTLNGGDISSNLVFSGSSSNWNVSHPGLQPNTSYTAVVTITDNDGQTHSTTVSFDTFSSGNFTWEAEDFDFDPANSPVPNGSGLRYIDHPVPTSVPATNSYYGQQGDLGIDYAQSFLNDAPVPTVYRVNDFIPVEVTTDPTRQSYVTDQVQEIDPYIQNYDVFNLTNGDWVNYTRTFPAGEFYLYARLSAGTAMTNFQCAIVTNGAGTSTQMSNLLGTFQAVGDGFASWQYAPLVSNNLPVILSLGGVETLQVSGEGQEHVDFFMLVSAAPVPVAITPSISGTNVVLSFPTQAGHIYTMYYKNNLTDPVWLQVGTPITANGLTQSVTDGLGQTQRFYRLIIQ
jgi:hypothetical protein